MRGYCTKYVDDGNTALLIENQALPKLFTFHRAAQGASMFLKEYEMCENERKEKIKK